MPVDISKAVAVITGAGSGIGRASSLAMARRGAKIVVTDIDGGRAAAVASEIGAAAIGVACDVTNQQHLEAVRDRTLDRFGRIDIVFSNVGVLVVGPVEAIPIEAWTRVIDINLMGTVRTINTFLPGLIAQGAGHFVFTASTAGLLPYGYDRLPYTATKHAVVGIAESLVLYLRPKGIGVSCLCPAGVMTNIVEQMTFYGEATEARGPSFATVDADSVAELVVDGITSDRFLLLTAPEAATEFQALATDTDGYLTRFTAGQAGEN